ncbi:type IVB pilus formation R64 PilN family outer membrane protein [Pseudomonas nitritireducens]|uniref:Type IVB pilus formation R64 PilN family outer membrane protein n=1 Tax=Pseudomonas nitroreducens TaxID=46680 RepID=A0A7W7KF73_PSENT|nr:secretin N-terminal domain-containing protein [Pseudomonas nitritireducens]MBB4861405.1 type IVB pilus formation R64 PilN family outer membrane protein [Pseudomonas nitritireducens]
MNKKLAVVPRFLPLALALAISGCNTVVDQAYDNVRGNMGSVKGSLDHNSKMIKPSAVQEVDDIWLGGDAYKVSQAELSPPVLQKQVTFSQQTPISVGELLTLISSQLHMKVVMSQDAVEYSSGTTKSSAAPVTPAGAPGLEQNIFSEMASTGTSGNEIKFVLANYKGSISNLLDLIAAKAGLFWRFEKGEIVFKRNETKTYVVDLPSGSTDYTAEMKSDLSSMGGDSGGSSGGSSGGGSGGSEEGSVHTTKTKIEGISAWATIQADVKTMLSPGGRVAVNNLVGSITVSDTPQVQSQISDYIKNQNALAGRQIAIKTDVFEISSDENGKFDTNILALYDWKGDLTLGLNGSTVSVGVSTGDPTTDNKFGAGNTAGFTLLRNNKNASLKTSTTVLANNGVPTPFQQMDEVGYLYRTTVTQSEGSSGEPIKSLEPGKTSQGFSMMLMPRITSTGKILMNFAVDSSRINSIDEYGDEKSGKIQLPNRSTNKYNQVVTVKNGQSIMIAAFDRTENTASINSPFGRRSWLLGGNQSGNKRKIMTMIVLTPYLMEK